MNDTAVTVPEAVRTLRSLGYTVTKEDDGNGAIGVYANGQHAFSYDDNHPTIPARYLRSTINDLEV